nr:MAG TPA: hypothetical protein [Caudoviricetes sp.]
MQNRFADNYHFFTNFFKLVVLLYHKGMYSH